MKNSLLIIGVIFILGILLYTVPDSIENKTKDLKNKEIPFERYVEIEEIVKEIKKIAPKYMPKINKEILEAVNESMTDNKITIKEYLEINKLLEEIEKYAKKRRIENIKNDLKNNI